MDPKNPPLPRINKNSKLFANGIAALLLAAFAFQSIASMLRHSATYDEQVYIAAGYTYFTTGENRLKHDAPPLIPFFSYVGLRCLESFTHRLGFSQTNPNWMKGADYAFAHDFFVTENSNGIAMLQAARIPIVLLGILLGFYIYRFGAALFGTGGGLLALAFYCFDPNMIAHSTVVSCDLGLAAFFLITHYYFYRAISGKSYLPLIPFSAFAALTVGVKFTGVLVFPVLGLTSAILLARPPAPLCEKLSMQEKEYRALLGKKAIAGVIGSLVCTNILLIMLYRNQSGIFDYIRGMRLIYANINPEYQYYFMGEFSKQAWAAYCIVSFLLKTPIPTLALFPTAMLLFRKSIKEWHKFLLLLVPFVVINIVAAFDHANFGLRRILFCLPFVYLMIGSLGPLLTSNERLLNVEIKKIISAIIGIAVIWMIAIAIWIHPNQLSYFNEIAGGPSGGYRYLVDSNIDWGQDLPALAGHLTAHSIDQVTLSYFGTAEASMYGINYRTLPYEETINPKPAVYAVSIHFLIYRRLLMATNGDQRMDWLVKYKPSARAGYSIYIYDFRNQTSAGSSR